MNIAVIGSGYWGVACSLILVGDGHSVTLICSKTNMSGSINAGGHFSLNWFSGDMKKEMEEAYQEAVRYGVKINTGGALINTIYDRKKYGQNYFKDKKDWWYFDPEQFLSLYEEDIIARVSLLQEEGRGGVRVWLGKNTEEEKLYGVFDKVVVCAGAWTDILLKNSNMKLTGVYPLPGSAVVMEGNTVEKLMLHQLNPFRQISIRNWGDNKIRVGETTEKIDSDSWEYISKMLNRVSHLTKGAKTSHAYYGYRAMLKKPFVGEVSENVIAATGGGRNGGIMSFWAAKKVLELI